MNEKNFLGLACDSVLIVFAQQSLGFDPRHHTKPGLAVTRL